MPSPAPIPAGSASAASPPTFRALADWCESVSALSAQEHFAHPRRPRAPEPSEPDLVAEIARAMQHRPLMGRLASIEAAYAGSMPAFAAQPDVAPPPLPPLTAVAPPTATVQQDSDETWASPSSSAEWLRKARRERNRARLRNAAAWLATLAIGGAIVAGSAAML